MLVSWPSNPINAQRAYPGGSDCNFGKERESGGVEEIYTTSEVFSLLFFSLQQYKTKPYENQHFPQQTFIQMPRCRQMGCLASFTHCIALNAARQD